MPQTRRIAPPSSAPLIRAESSESASSKFQTPHAFCCPMTEAEPARPERTSPLVELKSVKGQLQDTPCTPGSPCHTPTAFCASVSGAREGAPVVVVRIRKEGRPCPEGRAPTAAGQQFPIMTRLPEPVLRPAMGWIERRRRGVVRTMSNTPSLHLARRSLGGVGHSSTPGSWGGGRKGVHHENVCVCNTGRCLAARPRCG